MSTPYLNDWLINGIFQQEMAASLEYALFLLSYGPPGDLRKIVSYPITDETL